MPEKPSSFSRFLREYWAWILFPILIVVIGLVLLIWAAGADTGGGPFDYAL